MKRYCSLCSRPLPPDFTEKVCENCKKRIKEYERRFLEMELMRYEVLGDG